MASAGSVGAWLGGANGSTVGGFAVIAAVIYLLVTVIFLRVHRRD
jgi:hypothetical protein